MGLENEEIKIIKTEFMKLKKALVAKLNERQVFMYHLATDIYDKIKVDYKGKRKVDFRLVIKQELDKRLDRFSAQETDRIITSLINNKNKIKVPLKRDFLWFSINTDIFKDDNLILEFKTKEKIVDVSVNSDDDLMNAENTWLGKHFKELLEKV